MPKVLTEAQIKTFERDGCLSPVRAMSAERARHYRERFEALERRVPEIKKMKTKSHLLCPWVLAIAEDPHILDIFEDLIGPNLRCWSMAWRVKQPDGETFAGWHQDSAYGAALPVVSTPRRSMPGCRTRGGLAQVGNISTRRRKRRSGP